MHGFTTPFEAVDGIAIYRHGSLGKPRAHGYIGEYGSALLGEARCAFAAWRRKGFEVIHSATRPTCCSSWRCRTSCWQESGWIADVHDLWPENLRAKIPAKRGPVYWGIRLAERATWWLADAVIVTNAARYDGKARGEKTTGKCLWCERPRAARHFAPCAPELRMAGGIW